MKVFNDLNLRFENPRWAHFPELVVMDSILDAHPELLNLLKQDILGGGKHSRLGRQDSPSVEQIVRAAIYKEIKRIDYRQLEFDLSDSVICSEFLKLDRRRPFSFEVLYKYISRIQGASLQKLMVAINQLVIGEGMENVQKVRMDSTVVESPIHHTTNNDLQWDCIKKFYRLTKKLQKHCRNMKITNHQKQAKKNHFKISVSKSRDDQQQLFRTQLRLFLRIMTLAETVCQNLASAGTRDVEVNAIREKLQALLPIMEQVYSQSYRREILNESVPANEKLFSIYEQHTDIIVKGQKQVQFGHKVNLATGKSNLILDCDIIDGNPKDSSLFAETLHRINSNYHCSIRDVCTDGGYASLDNARIAKGQGIINIVFNKIVGSLTNIVTSLSMETRLKKWRSGMEAVISNLKRRFDLFRCEWKSKPHFDAKVFWSVLAYNLRVIAAWCLSQSQTA